MEDNKLKCSFCNKEQDKLDKLIVAGDRSNDQYVAICNECLELCFDIILDAKYEGAPEKEIVKKYFDGGISLDDLGINPVFSKRRFDQKSQQGFVLCPFSEPFNTIYSDHIRPSIESVEMVSIRADDIFGVQPIIEDIWEQINTSFVIIADITGRNPNVLYEVGLAHTIGKPTILITQNIEDIPFDLRHHRFIKYEYTPRGCKELEMALIKTIESIKHVKNINDARKSLRSGMRGISWKNGRFVDK